MVGSLKTSGLFYKKGQKESPLERAFMMQRMELKCIKLYL